MNKIFTCPILNTNIAVTDMNRTVKYLKDNLEELRGRYICVSNVHTTVMSFKDMNYRAVQNGAALALPDGKPLSVVSRRRGFKDAKRVPGPDLMLEMFKQPGYRHYFYGSSEETLTKLREELLKKYPDINIVGMYSPPFRPLSDEEDATDIKRINDTNPDFIWVGLGAPKQENWMAAHENRVTGVMLGVGAGFDFHAGTVKRAPKWVQELCLEWFYRLLKDPKRLFKRYLSTNASFIWNTIREGHKVKKQIRREHQKIAMIGHKRIPSREGGVEIVVEKLSSRLIEQGYFVDAYNRSGYHVSGKQYDAQYRKIFNGIRIITIPTFQNGKLNAIVYTVLATIRSLFGKYDVYHFHAEGPCAMLWLPKLFHKHIIVTIHGLDWQRAKWGAFASKVLLRGEKNAVKYADEIIVLSDNVRQYFKDTYGRDVHFIPNGIDKPESVKARDMVTKWGIKPGKYILFLARIVPEKGLHYLIEAFKQIDTDMQLVIAGGSSHSSDYLSQMQELSKGDERIIYTNFVQGRYLEELYSNAYMFVLPSDIEGMSISLLEAMAYGNCCLISDIPENVEVAGSHAAVFKHADTADLKRALEELINNPALAAEYRSKSQEFILNKYNWDDVTKATVELYGK